MQTEKKKVPGIRDARERVLSWLAKRDYTSEELRTKLRKQHVAEKTIEAVLQDCSERGWLNEQRYVEEYLRCHVPWGWGPLRVAQELERKGISLGVIEENLRSFAEDFASYLAEEHERRYGRTLPQTPKDYQTRLQFFLRRGFSADDLYAHWSKLSEARARTFDLSDF